MTKVAIVVNSAWQAVNFRLNLARSLKKEGYGVVFIAPKDGQYSKELEQEFKFIPINFESGGLNPMNDIKTFFMLFKTYRRDKFDIVLNFTIKPNIYSTMATNLLAICSINNITGLGTVFIKKSILTNFVELLYKLTLPYATHVFFQNLEDLNYFVDKRLSLASKSSVIPGSGVDTNRFLPSCDNLSGVFRFLLVARVIRDKGVMEYIEAAHTLKKKYSSVECRVLGELSPDNRTSIPEDEIRGLHADGVIHYLGVASDVRDQLSVVDCVVLPSYREGSPRSLMEASSMSLPVIATDVTGCRSVVDNDRTGLLCKPKDAFDLSLKMEKMLNMSEEDRKKMGELGREKMLREFDESIVINKYIEVMNDIFKGTV